VNGGLSWWIADPACVIWGSAAFRHRLREIRGPPDGLTQLGQRRTPLAQANPRSKPTVITEWSQGMTTYLTSTRDERKGPVNLNCGRAAQSHDCGSVSRLELTVRRAGP
jgi:hypothetical protein